MNSKTVFCALLFIMLAGNIHAETPGRFQAAMREKP
jgi:hypothetical protein